MSNLKVGDPVWVTSAGVVEPQYNRRPGQLAIRAVVTQLYAQESNHRPYGCEVMTPDKLFEPQGWSLDLVFRTESEAREKGHAILTELLVEETKRHSARVANLIQALNN